MQVRGLRLRFEVLSLSAEGRRAMGDGRREWEENGKRGCVRRGCVSVRSGDEVAIRSRSRSMKYEKGDDVGCKSHNVYQYED